MQEKKRKPRKRKTTENQEEVVEAFMNAEGIEERLILFSKLPDDATKREMLEYIPEEQRYKFIGKFKDAQSIVGLLKEIGENDRDKTFKFVIKQMKGNSRGLLNILSQIDFEIELPKEMLTFRLNNLNDLSWERMTYIAEHVTNYRKIKFELNDSKKRVPGISTEQDEFTYSFTEIYAIIVKLQELTEGITADMSESDRFYTIYSRLANGVVYDHSAIIREEEAERFDKYFLEGEEYINLLKSIRRRAARTIWSIDR